MLLVDIALLGIGGMLGATIQYLILKHKTTVNSDITSFYQLTVPKELALPPIDAVEIAVSPEVAVSSSSTSDPAAENDRNSDTIIIEPQDLARLQQSAVLKAWIDEVDASYKEWEKENPTVFFRTLGLAGLNLAHAIDRMELHLTQAVAASPDKQLKEVRDVVAASTRLENRVREFNKELRSLSLLYRRTGNYNNLL